MHGNTRHGHTVNRSKTPTYVSYEKMLARCYNPNEPNYKYYGGKGIIVCDRWCNSYQAFLDDVGERPKGKTLDRIDRNWHYNKLNCTWSTPATQARNRSTTKLTVDDARDIRDWVDAGFTRKFIAENFNVSVSTITKIILGYTWKGV